MRSYGAELLSASIDTAHARTRAPTSCPSILAFSSSYRKEAERVACSTKKPGKMPVRDSYFVLIGILPLGAVNAFCLNSD